MWKEVWGHLKNTSWLSSIMTVIFSRVYGFSSLIWLYSATLLMHISHEVIDWDFCSPRGWPGSQDSMLSWLGTVNDREKGLEPWERMAEHCCQRQGKGWGDQASYDIGPLSPCTESTHWPWLCPYLQGQGGLWLWRGRGQDGQPSSHEAIQVPQPQTLDTAELTHCSTARSLLGTRPPRPTSLLTPIIIRKIRSLSLWLST